MNEIKKCSLSGIGFVLEKEAYNRLNDYLNSLKKAYQNSSDCDEILADIEARIAELILSAQNNTQNIVCVPLIENIIAQLGSPEAISGEEEKPNNQKDSRIPRRLYRDLENAKLGGVCSGLAKHFGVDAVWIRLAILSPLVLIIIGAPYLHWLSQIGGNLLGIFLITYLILWFAIPGAKSARQKLEMEGEQISAQNIASRQGATQEEKAKSSVASAVTTLGRALVIVMKAFFGLLLFPLTAFIFTLLIIIIGLFAGFSEFNFVHFGDFGNLPEVAAEVGMPLMILSLLLVVVPAIYIAYLLITLLINRKPRLWVLLLTILAWLLLLFGTIIAGLDYAEGYSNNTFFIDSEVERILKKSDESNLSRQIMESLNAEPDQSQQAEIERLLNDKDAKSIDK